MTKRAYSLRQAPLCEESLVVNVNPKDVPGLIATARGGFDSHGKHQFPIATKHIPELYTSELKMAMDDLLRYLKSDLANRLLCDSDTMRKVCEDCSDGPTFLENGHKITVFKTDSNDKYMFFIKCFVGPSADKDVFTIYAYSLSALKQSGYSTILAPEPEDDIVEKVREANQRKAETALYDLVETMRQKRVEKGFSQDALAKATGLNQSSIARIERHEIVATMDSMAKIAAALGINLNLLDGNSKATPMEEITYADC